MLQALTLWQEEQEQGLCRLAAVQARHLAICIQSCQCIVHCSLLCKALSSSVRADNEIVVGYRDKAGCKHKYDWSKIMVVLIVIV